jgi:CRISPR system Cascade subunit CasC
MTTFLQLHLLTFVPPANLNRDDMGKPKTAIVGGEMRLRLSSQSLKRAWRTSDIFRSRLEGHLGSRTQRFGEEIKSHLIERGIDAAKATEIAREIVSAFGKPKSDKDKNPTYTEQLAFLSPEEKQAALDLAVARAEGRAEPLDPKKTAQSLLKAADTAADIAMFGRMFADNADFNREASVQVAHAITTHRIAIEDDFYTAVDDLKRPSEDAGAGFVGNAGFGSGIFYLYICVDTGLLTANLGGDKALAKGAVAALIEAAAKVAPNGKQASFASRANASYILAEKGSEQPRTLAAAFIEGVKPGDLLANSIERLQDTRSKFERAYGSLDVTHEIMNAPAGKGSLSEIIEFCTIWPK